MPDDDDGSAGVEHEETLVPAEDSGDGESEWSPFDEVVDEFVPRPIPRTMGADGMPRPNVAPPKSDIPELSTETLVCMGDFSWFAIRDPFGEVIARFEASEVERAATGEWLVKTELAIERTKLWRERDRKRSIESLGDPMLQAIARAHGHADPSGMIEDAGDRALFGRMLNYLAENGIAVRATYDWVSVEPARPECVHYVRQLGQADENPEIQKLFRLCSARRSTEGAFMSVSDRAVWACSMREPRHPESETRLDEFDARKIREGRARKYLPLFGGGDGIFEGKASDG